MITDYFSLAGKKALITGAGKGIGARIATAYAEMGCDVALIARTKSDLDSVAEAVSALGREALVYPCDIQDEAALAAQSVYIASNPFEVGSKNEWEDSGNNTPYARHHAAQHSVLRSVIRTHGFYDLFIIRPDDGRVVYSVFKEIDFGTSLLSGPHRDSGLARAFDEALNIREDAPAAIVDF